MPGQYRYSLDLLVEEVKELYSLGIRCVAIFPAVEESLKTSDAKEAYNPKGLNQRAIQSIKEVCPDMTVMTDIALDPYNSDGHDGIVDKKTGEILNDKTLEVLAKMAVVQAKAGTDIVGPSDMMDGRVEYIRKELDDAGFQNVLIMSYTAKYASSFYGPFRDALDSAPKAGDKKTYQMDYSNSVEAIREAKLDECEGADILMVKPGLPYLDIVKTLKDNSQLPIAVYNVSGEYAMIKAAAEKGWLDEEKVMVESLMAFKRAGASIILTYFAKDMAKFLKK
jgi:porphobilinogen synthase